MNETLHWADLQDTGNAQAQLVLYAIARHADWTTGECFPKQDDLARMSKCTDRTVRTYLKQLEDQGLIEREERTRKSGGQTSDLIRLKGYAEWVAALRTGGKVAAPLIAKERAENISGQPGSLLSAPPGKQLSTPAGNMLSAPKELSLEHSNELSASVQAREASARPTLARPAVEIQIKSGEMAFGEWIEFLKANGQAALAADMRDAGVAFVGARWPKSGLPMPRVGPIPKLEAVGQSNDLMRRITGDRE